MSRQALPALLLLLALGFRAALPAGFMPHAELGLVLCNGNGSQFLTVDPLTGTLKAEGEAGDNGCDFSPLLSASAPPAAPGEAVLFAADPGRIAPAPAPTVARARAPPQARGPPRFT